MLPRELTKEQLESFPPDIRSKLLYQAGFGDVSRGVYRSTLPERITDQCSVNIPSTSEIEKYILDYSFYQVKKVLFVRRSKDRILLVPGVFIPPDGISDVLMFGASVTRGVITIQPNLTIRSSTVVQIVPKEDYLEMQGEQAKGLSLQYSLLFSEDVYNIFSRRLSCVSNVNNYASRATKEYFSELSKQLQASGDREVCKAWLILTIHENEKLLPGTTKLDVDEAKQESCDQLLTKLMSQLQTILP